MKSRSSSTHPYDYGKVATFLKTAEKKMWVRGTAM